MPAASLFLVILVVLVALAFAFTNGLHDAANSTATLVSTHVLSLLDVSEIRTGVDFS